VLQPLTTGEPVGEWHLTVGNPMNPIMMIGNLICKNASFKFGKTLGPEDFPTELEVKVTLEHGRGRDMGDIQSIFNLGQGRFYNITKTSKGNKATKSDEPWDTGASSKSTDNDTAVISEPQAQQQELERRRKENIDKELRTDKQMPNSPLVTTGQSNAGENDVKWGVDVNFPKWGF
jgi:hypothetical protein